MNYPIIFFVFVTIAGSNAALLRSTSWSSLLGAEDFFPVSLDVVHGKSGSNQILLSELEELLNEPEALGKIYGNYLKSYNKEWESYKIRQEMFKTALLEIAAHNLEAEAGHHSWTQGVNQFTDLTEEEVQSQFTGHRTGLTLTSWMENSTVQQLPDYVKRVGNVPDELDWRTEGKVGSVKHQGKCGSCYAFTSAGALESAHSIKNGGDPLDLSEQELVDCSKENGNGGCGGGDYPPSYDYMKNGLTTEDEYPYTGKDDGECEAEGKSKPAKVESYGRVTRSEENVKSAVAEYGPTAIGVSTQNWNRYKRGVFDSSCGRNIGHAVLAVGYGTDDGQYWIIKNSWGTRWGEKGYMRLRRGKNLCRVADDVVYMTAASTAE